jgi:hypothetical protein
MIRISGLHYKITLAFILSIVAFSATAQINMGARGLGLGNANTSLVGDHWSLFSNPAFINNEQMSIGFYGLRNYGFSELTDMSAIGSLPTKYGAVALGFHHYGNNLFNETRIRFGYKNEWRSLHFGVVANYNHISFGGDYGSGGAIGVDVGVAAQLTEDLWIGAKSDNINMPEYNGLDEELPRNIAIGFSYGLNELAVFAFDVFKDVRFPVSYRGGVEIKVIDELKGRIGVTNEPLTYSFGFGYGRESWDINFAVQKHELLGFSPGFDFMIFF